MSPFTRAVNAAMRELAQDPRTIFVGQSVRYDGAAVYDSLDGVPMDKRREMPVIEDFQMGFCTGLALMGQVPICIFPRMDFLLLAMNQLVNHLDKLPRWGWHARMIIRTMVGPTRPLDAGPQHTQNYTRAFWSMLTSIPVLEVTEANDVGAVYRAALDRPGATLIVENPR